MTRTASPLHRYEPSPDELARLEGDHTYHPLQEGQGPRYEHIRGVAREYGKEILRLCPPSRERSVALTKLDEVVFWANAAIARNEKGEVGGGEEARRGQEA